MGTRRPQPQPHRTARFELERSRSREEVARRLEVCPVCGTSFDPSRYQVIVDAVGAFDRVACADAALADRRWQEDELARRRARATLAVRQRRRRTAG